MTFGIKVTITIAALFSLFQSVCSQLVETELPEDIQSKISKLLDDAASAESQGNQVNLADYYNSIGFLYWDYGSTRKAVEYLNKSVQINLKIGNQNAVQKLNNNLGMIYYDALMYRESIKCFETSKSINIQLNRRIDVAYDNYNIALALQGEQNYSKSNSILLDALTIFQEKQDISGMKNCYSLLAENYESLGESAKSIEYYNLFLALTKKISKDKIEQIETQIRDVEQQKAIKEQELSQTFDTLRNIKKEKAEIEVMKDSLHRETQLQNLVIEAQQKAQRTTLLSAAIIISVILIFFVILYFQFKAKKRTAILLAEKNSKIEKQKEEIETQRDFAHEQTKKITASIRYAQRIQNAILPPVDQIEQAFKDHFILFKPRDIVSGDFYWFTQKEDVAIIAAVDCTGHGVPGAFMSMLGVAFLNEIVNKIVVNKHINALQANEILNQLRLQIINSMHQTNTQNESKDGMDMALCVFDFEQNKLQFAGAHNPLIIIREGELIEFKGDRMPVSIHRKKDIPFTNNNFELKENDMIYMFSDGIVDQFGGESGEKFLSKNLRKLLTEIVDLPLPDQKQTIEETFEQWKGSFEQLDDVLVVGVKYTKYANPVRSNQTNDWSNKNILIVEDTDMNYILLVEALRKTGINISRANHGKDAVELCQINKYDLILMDINMPVMDGKTATREIRKSDINTPIVAQTAQYDDSERDECMKAGCNDFISKPVDLKTFISIIQRNLT